MSNSKPHYHFHIGLRNIKTAVATTLCAFVYLLINRNPTFACIGAVFGLGKDMPDSRLNGGNRFFGTLFGGFLGMGLFRLPFRRCCCAYRCQPDFSLERRGSAGRSGVEHTSFQYSR